MTRCKCDDDRDSEARTNRQRTSVIPTSSPTAVNEQLRVLLRVTSALESAGIAYMVTGSIASAHYSHPRMTRDIDVVVELQPDDAERIVAPFGDEFDCQLETIRVAIERRSVFNLIHTDAIVKVDFVVRKDTPYHREEFGRRRHGTVNGHNVWLVSPEDSILSKLLWAKDSRSELQLRDVRQLISAQADLDWSYLNLWAPQLGVADLLRESRS